MRHVRLLVAGLGGLAVVGLLILVRWASHDLVERGRESTATVERSDDSAGALTGERWAGESAETVADDKADSRWSATFAEERRAERRASPSYRRSMRSRSSFC